MEVAHVRDHVTHAVIGGQLAESFGISDDPAFFHVLSSTLYRDKKRAVVRETLCNGWDAHIEAGLTSIPLEVTLTSHKLTIQDFGTGIDKALIKPIYGVYGASTKKQNQNVTGGFGLGCKAPFAYVDHFEVISCHHGQKTVYRMSKSSGAVMGKPSIQPMVTVPTDDTGITVSMAIQLGDQVVFNKLIRQIAKLGGMKVKLNGELLDSVPYESAKNGYIMIKAEDFGDGSDHIVQVRYGHVTYPIEVNDAYKEQYNQLKKFIQRVARGRKINHWDDNHSSGWVLILQAEPDTISVTPSRESLSMTDHTIETITGLIENFLKTTAKHEDLQVICSTLVKRSISDTFLVSNPFTLLKTEVELPNRKVIETYTSDYIVDSVSAGGHYLLRQYPDFKNFHHKDIMLRLNAIIQSGICKRGLVQSFRASYLKAHYKGQRTSMRRSLHQGINASADRWYLGKFVWPILKAMQGEQLISSKHLYVWNERVNARGSRELGTIPFQEYGKSFTSYLPLLRGVVIVAHNRIAVEDRAHLAPMMKNWFGNPKGSLLYLVPRTGNRAVAVVDFFKKLGFHVLDLTQRQKWEPEATSVAPIPKVVPTRKRVKGYPLLSEMQTSFKVESLFDENVKRTEKPEFFAMVSRKSGNYASAYVSTENMKRIILLWGDKGVGLVNSTQADKVATSTGAQDVFVWVRKQLLHQYKTNPAIREHHENTAHLDGKSSVTLDYDEEVFLKAIVRDQWLRNEFKLPNPPTDEVHSMVSIVRDFNYYHNTYPEIKEIFDLIKSWGVNPALEAIIAKIQKSKILRVINGTQASAALGGGSNLTPAEKITIRTMLLTALRG